MQSIHKAHSKNMDNSPKFEYLPRPKNILKFFQKTLTKNGKNGIIFLYFGERVNDRQSVCERFVICLCYFIMLVPQFASQKTKKEKHCI